MDVRHGDNCLRINGGKSVRHDNISPRPAKKTLSELENAWEEALAEAKQRARAAGRTDIADYLDLKRRNDLLRRTATEWLAERFTTLAGVANRGGASIQIETLSEHRFMSGHATMVGSKLTLRCGVRALAVEAGWPRTPRDGFIRGGGLARANFKHFGRKHFDAELWLEQTSKGNPRWLIARKSGDRAPLSEDHLREHIALLIGPN